MRTRFGASSSAALRDSISTPAFAQQYATPPYIGTCEFNDATLTIAPP